VKIEKRAAKFSIGARVRYKRNSEQSAFAAIELGLYDGIATVVGVGNDRNGEPCLFHLQTESGHRVMPPWAEWPYGIHGDLLECVG